MELIERKEIIEKQISEQFTILSTNQSTMNTPLVDTEGFPRADIDVWAVRHARVRIIELKNDLNALMDTIAVALAAVAKDDAASSNSDNKTPLTNGVSHSGSHDTLKAFAKVNGVAPGSPAATAVSSGSSRYGGQNTI